MPTEFSATALWGSAPADVWALGSVRQSFGRTCGIYHWDGSAWSLSEDTRDTCFADVWGSSASDVLAVGCDAAREPTVARWDGVGWVVAPEELGPDCPLAVWGFAADDAWIAAGATLDHWDGASWTPFLTSPSGYSTAVWGAAPDDVWAAGTWGDDGMIHWDGTSWSVPPGAGELAGRHITGLGPDDAWMVGGPDVLHWDGSAWSPEPCVPGDVITAVWATSPDELWVVGSAILRRRH